VIFTDNLGGLVFDACRDIPCGDRRTGEALLVARGGCALRQIMSVSLRHGLSGIEGLVGIPGSVGGAVAGNAGAFGCEIKDVIQSLRLLMPGGEVRDLARKEMSFGYRTMTLPEGAVILAAALALQRDDPHEVRRRMKGFMAEKRSRQPVGEHSAGCVFKNPAGTSAGKLIDEAGCKGMAVGAVMVSPVHANFFVNGGDGTAKDFTALMEAVGERVRRRSGIELEPEIRIIGEGA
jgi:UDP-N-acetylmuramate dehydrogenase